MIKFNQKETKFLESLEEARLATSHGNIPHVKPVSFVFLDNAVLVVTDYNTRTFTNIKSNAHTSIVIDIYKSGDHEQSRLYIHSHDSKDGSVQWSTIGHAGLYKFNV